MSKEKLPPLSERRRFLLQALQGIGLATLGALTWSAYLDEASASSLFLRPPGALGEKDFLSHCIRCGLCVEACPYDTLKLARAGDNVPVGTPYFKARQVPCYMCKDVPCVPPCPSGALDIKLLTNSQKEEKLDIGMAKMGVAVIDSDQCIAFWGIQCDACYRACPLINEAIVIDASRNVRTGKHAFMAPRVIPDVCTGCGMCEKACVTEKASIFVLPLSIAKGKAGSNYIKGWDAKDESRLVNQKGGGETTVTPVSKQKAVDYLNSEEF
ncbi:MAG: ferredoxin-type protein NapG [Sulfuricurvum sp.]